MERVRYQQVVDGIELRQGQQRKQAVLKTHDRAGAPGYDDGLVDLNVSVVRSL